MPELPDLLYIVARLRESLSGRSVTAERVAEPVVMRFTVRGNLSLLLGRRLEDVFRKSHLVVLRFEGLDLAVNPMLAGRFRLAVPGEMDEAALAFALALGDLELRYVDDKKMGKAYLITRDDWQAIPGLQTGGVDILSPEFTRAAIAPRRAPPSTSTASTATRSRSARRRPTGASPGSAVAWCGCPSTRGWRGSSIARRRRCAPLRTASRPRNSRPRSAQCWALALAPISAADSHKNIGLTFHSHSDCPFFHRAAECMSDSAFPFRFSPTQKERGSRPVLFFS